MPRLEIYRDNSKRLKSWRWRRKSGNNQIIASSGEGYTRRASAKRAAKHGFPSDGEPEIMS